MLLAVACIAIIACSATVAWFARDLRRARLRVSHRSQIVETSAGGLEFATLGDGQPVFVVHGAGGGFDQAIDIAAALAGHGMMLLAPSRFGYLASSMPRDASPAAQADSFAELLDELGLEQVSLLAVSAGAWSALEFAARYPNRCRALVLLVPAQALPHGVANHGGPLVRVMFQSNLIMWLTARLMRVALTTFGSPLLGTPAAVIRSASPGERARLREICDHLLPISSRAAGIQVDLDVAAAPPNTNLRAINCPVLAVSATDDPFGTAERAQSIAGEVASGKAVIYSDGGHALVGRQTEALEEIASFLRSV